MFIDLTPEQHRLRLQRGQALNLTHDLAHFLCGHRHVFHDCVNLHDYFASALAVCAPCFLNVRVGENSPSR